MANTNTVEIWRGQSAIDGSPIRFVGWYTAIGAQLDAARGLARQDGLPFEY